MSFAGIFKIFENKRNKQWTISINKTNLKSINPTITSKKDLILKLEKGIKKRRYGKPKRVLQQE